MPTTLKPAPMFQVAAVWASGMLVSLAMMSSAMAKEFSSQLRATDMIELYTSEGCSSCPRADRWLSTLSHQPDLFKNLIPMAFHVDYWDYIGWEDRFATPAYSQRQRQYVQQGRARQTYTPQFISNGAEWRAWFSGDRTWSKNQKIVGVLKASLPEHSQRLQVSFQAEKDPSVFSPKPLPDHYVLNIAILGMGLQSEVSAGENAHRVLKHDFVVLQHQQKKVSAKAASWQLQRPTIPMRGQTRSALVVWLSMPESQQVIQATGGYL